ncbi:hypothetical protein [Amantichitinum ursilacus]|uniref:Uncharacterized protein n=1 Tax=Amantichitinum ursilacus TaxID=857265 RepID=A0A0N1JRF8_9NEIS|nr:hypothetical protein [Amantichitinum ursilacus]KPC49119.1 hypothetical protein WG78_21405 [Amantichitinum ursilacus]
MTPIQLHISLAPVAETELARCQHAVLATARLVQVERRALAAGGLYLLGLDLEVDSDGEQAAWHVERLAADLWRALGRYTRLSVWVTNDGAAGGDSAVDVEPEWLLLDEVRYREVMQAFRFAWPASPRE